jgi:predicted RNA polymerase sigma factor
MLCRAHADVTDEINACSDAGDRQAWAEALQLCDQAMATPGLSGMPLAAALLNRGRTLTNLGRPKEAVADLTRAIALAPGSSTATIIAASLISL